MWNFVVDACLEVTKNEKNVHTLLPGPSERSFVFAREQSHKNETRIVKKSYTVKYTKREVESDEQHRKRAAKNDWKLKIEREWNICEKSC